MNTREEILKSVNYRQQEIKCCETCRNSYRYHEGDLYCGLLENEIKNEYVWVGETRVCDKYKEEER